MARDYEDETRAEMPIPTIGERQRYPMKEHAEALRHVANALICDLRDSAFTLPVEFNLGDGQIVRVETKTYDQNMITILVRKERP